MQLEQKNVLVGVSGGIAAYKTPDLVRKLKAEGANVRVVLTDSASHFVSSLSLQAVSGEKVSQHLLDEDAEAGMGHIELARWADIFLVAPATANIIAKLALGMADDLLTTLFLASSAPTFIAPAMNQQMWAAPATTHNIETLMSRGVMQIGPAAGEQACGDVGYGRMAEPLEIVEALCSYQAIEHDNLPLKGLKVLITAGPTREVIDPVRYISNHSSGKMGYALAKGAKALGAEVVLVSGPVNLSSPHGVSRHNVISAQEMLESVEAHVDSADIFIACAAVADYRVANVQAHKLKKKEGEEDLSIHFVQNPDILKAVASRANPPFTLGFAAETQNIEEHGRAKLEKKQLNMIAANDVSVEGLGFDSDRNALLVITNKNVHKLKPDSKEALAISLLHLMHDEYKQTQDGK